MKKTQNPVFVSGLGVISCAGKNPRELLESVVNGKSGIHNGVGVVEGFGDQETPDRVLAMLFEVTRQAMGQSEMGCLTDQDGVIVASTTTRLGVWERAFLDTVGGKAGSEKFLEYFPYRKAGGLLEEFQQAIQHRGPGFLVLSACAAQLQGVAMAFDWIRSGRVNRCLVLGVETLSTLTQEGFRSLQLTTKERAKPFDRARTGINLGEGAAAILLTKDSLKNQSHSFAVVEGVGVASDAYHMTSPSPGGEGLVRAIDNVLLESGVSASEIPWVYTHGTGSRHNDLAESNAIAARFSPQTFVTSTKPIHGHTLACAGGMESVLAMLAMSESLVLPTLGLQDLDSDLPKLDYVSKLKTISVSRVLKTCLGFGGVNVAVLFRRTP